MHPTASATATLPISSAKGVPYAYCRTIPRPSSGPLAHAEGPPGWLMAALRSDSTRPHLAVTITWNAQGLRAAPQNTFEGEHVIAIADATYPSLRVTLPGTAEEPRWIALRRGATLQPPPVSAALL